jgi:arylsulfatase A-like enzyme
MIAPQRRFHLRRALLPGILLLVTTACARSPKQVVLTADMPLHLEDHLDAATFINVAAATPAAPSRAAVEWRFDQPQPEWKATPLWNAPYGAPVLTRTGDGLRVTLTPQLRVQQPAGALRGALRVDVPDWDRNDWAEVVIRARASPTSSVNVLGLGFNLREGRGEAGAAAAPPFQFAGEETAVIRDGTVRTYRLRINARGGLFQGAWRHLLLHVGSPGAPGSIDLLSVGVVPKGAVPVPTTAEWHFDQPQPDWKPLRAPGLTAMATGIARTTDALRVTLRDGPLRPDGTRYGGAVYVDLQGWRREEWARVSVRARTTGVTNMTLGLNVSGDVTQSGFARSGGSTPIVSDGSIHTYEIRPEWERDGYRPPSPGPWLRVGLGFRAREPGSIDILSVSVTPIATLYAQDRDFRSIAVGGVRRRSVYMQAPGRLEYRVQVPERGRLHTALGVLGSGVEFRVTARAANSEATTLLRETHVDPEQWADRTIDLSAFAGQAITLGLEASSSESPTIAFWGSPTVSGSQRAGRPNVIFYVIDGGGADYMSVYGYNRRTTPTLEKLAAEGAVFERAYSNSSWTKPSTTSFMTGLHNSVLGNTKGDTRTGGRFEALPEQAVTMAERFHGAGYETAVFTSNPWAATLSSLERGVDLLRDSELGESTSSAAAHAAFWNWREAYAGQPYWVHFQTTDVHEPYNDPVPPFAGIFVSPADQNALRLWQERLRGEQGGRGIYSEAFAKTGISRLAFNTLRLGTYDQQMAYNDYQLGRLIDRLKASGEWQHTVLIVAADHSIESAMDDMGLALLDPLPPSWNSVSLAGPMLRPSISRVPLIVVWPGKIAGGQRFDHAVSMIDVLPTVLDLAGLPRPEVTQGQSLAPLLRGDAGWTPRPVILDEFAPDLATGQLQGRLEVVDGRWAASMWIGPPRRPNEHRPWPVLVYDLWNDPLCVAPVNEQQPELVQKYTKFLEDTWKDHQALAKQFKPGAKTALTPEQLERLRALGYIR